MFKNISSLKIFYLLICFQVSGLFLFAQSKKNYYRYIDSANVYINSNPKLASSFLDSIPKPLEQNISGRLADYYAKKVIIHDFFKEYAKVHQSNLLVLKYAEKEKNYKEAGQASLDLFANLYFIEKDSTAYKYLDKAKNYFKKGGYKNGLLEVGQMSAYTKFLDSKHQESNDLLLPKLNDYKQVLNEDGYYYMFATYMLASNYIFLDEINEANQYLSEFKSLKHINSIDESDFLSFETSLNITLAESHFKNKALDSALYYLKKSSKMIDYMGEDVQREYYNLFSEVYKLSGDIDASKAYIDSLRNFENKIYKNTIESSVLINENILNAHSEASAEKEKYFSFGEKFTLILIGLLSILGLWYYLLYKRQKDKIIEYDSQATNFSYLKSNNEQLAVKVHGLEEYIKNLKEEIKAISNVKNVESQRARITELYKNLHINSSTILDKSDNHLELVNNLNIDFFKQIEERYPDLNKSEIIICYYLFMGFCNKEIAVFLNTSVRSVESRRYRISKKMDFNKKETTLLKHIQDTFAGVR